MNYDAGRRRFGPGSNGNDNEQQRQGKKQEDGLKEEKKLSRHHMPEDEEIEEELDLNGFQVVRREFFAHTREPSIVFNDGKISVNTACVRKFPDVEYVQILVHREKQQLAIRPCDELDLFAFRWGSTKNGKRFPRAVTGKLFFMMVCDMMGWNPNYRYKILGRLRKANGEQLFAFDLKSFETYERSVPDEAGKRKASRTPVFPLEWKNQFGVPFEEQHQALQINLFDGFTLFSLKDKKNKNDEQIENDVIKPSEEE